MQRISYMKTHVLIFNFTISCNQHCTRYAPSEKYWLFFWMCNWRYKRKIFCMFFRYSTAVAPQAENFWLIFFSTSKQRRRRKKFGLFCFFSTLKQRRRRKIFSLYFTNNANFLEKRGGVSEFVKKVMVGQKKVIGGEG